MMLALAHDFSKDGRFVNGVSNAMDYILGRNPLDQSYITGYGDRPLENPYHRFWCRQANPKYPPPPPGVLSGGPNSELNDPYVQAAGVVPCAPMKCFIDNGEAWSVNEVTINWNAPLAWVAAWLDEKQRPGASSTPAKTSTGKRK
jgi:endoglucanase